MNSKNLIPFFLREITLKTWFKVLINFTLQLFLVFFEILFLSTFFLLINGNLEGSYFAEILNIINIYLTVYLNNFSAPEINILLLIVVLIIKNFISLYQIYFYSNLIFKLTTYKSSNILRSFLEKSFESFYKKISSDYIKHVIKDIENVFIGIFGLLIAIMSEIIYLLFLLIFISTLTDIKLNLNILFLSLFLISILYVLLYFVKKLGNIRAVNEIKLFKTLAETLSIFKEIKINNKSNLFVNRFKFFLDKYYNSRIIVGVLNVVPKFVFEIFLILFLFVIYKEQSLSIEKFVLEYSVLALALLRMIPSFSKISQNWSMIFYNIKAVEYIESDLKNFSSKKIIREEKVYSIILKNIEINFIKDEKNVNFLSKKLKKVNYQFSSGKIYGIYGESGKGKTTLLNIIAGFISPYKGDLFINNRKFKINEITKNFKIGFASQNTSIIDENLYTNILFDYPKSEIENQKFKKKIDFYLREFNLGKFNVKKFFNNQKNSSIKNMSGGEMQRIGFIRSIIDNPSLILLDEPTASLDHKNEKKIFEYLLKIKKDKIIIVTTHKKDTKKYFDEVIYL